MTPQNAQGFRKSGQDETSITLQWNKVNNNVSFVLQFNGTETNIRAPDGDGAVTHTVSSLTAGTKYTFTLFYVFENVRSSGVSITAASAPQNTEGFGSSRQDETSITLQWNKVNNNVSFVLQFNGTETYIMAPDGDGAVTHTVSSLTAGTKYTFTLFSVFESVRSSGLQLTAVTAPINTESFRPSAQNETSITLQWNKVNNNVSFVLQFNGTETNISAPDGDGAVTHTVSSLTAGTKYTFTLFSVFESIRSSGRQLTAVTAPSYLSDLLHEYAPSHTLRWTASHPHVTPQYLGFPSLQLLSTQALELSSECIKLQTVSTR
ncbi:receptor-type tyrosine-protein phosphatase H-like [Leuresthes tenuis]|uniref:receptor-type tyrosine-protein phosphatase H-like n=1 Tax=Leuresthes tenuis TaxID=355514 RepID=UPI003B50975E